MSTVIQHYHFFFFERANFAFLSIIKVSEFGRRVLMCRINVWFGLI